MIIDGNGGDEEAETVDTSDELSADDLAAFEQMQKDTPPQTKDADDQASDGDPEKKVEIAEDDPDNPGEITIDAEGKTRDATGKFVPKSAFLRVKEERKQERDSRIKLEERLGVLTEIINAPDPKDKAAGPAKDPANPWDEDTVDPAEDIFKAFDQQRRRSEHLLKQHTQSQQKLQERDTEAAIVSDYVSDAKRLAAAQMAKGETVQVGDKAVPAFAAAYEHLVTLRHAQLEAVGLTDKAQRDQIIANEERSLVHDARKAKRSPAEAIFNLAKASGFKMTEKQATNGKANGNGHAAEKLTSLNKAMAATKSLSSARGGSAYEGLTAKQIADMDDEDFAAFADKLSEKQLAKLLGE